MAGPTHLTASPWVFLKGTGLELRRNHGDETRLLERGNPVALTMNFSVSGAKAVKSFLFLSSFSSVAEAKTKISPVAACCWLNSKQGLEDMTWSALEVPPPM